MIGIGGAGMRNLAKLLLARGDRGDGLGPEGLEGAGELSAAGRRCGSATTPLASVRPTPS